jgi:hypothetical protein
MPGAPSFVGYLISLFRIDTIYILWDGKITDELESIWKEAVVV